METLVKKTNKIVEHDAETVLNETIKVISEIDDFVSHNEYSCNEVRYSEKELTNAIGDLSLNERRKLKNSINIFRSRQSIRSANRFLHVLFSKVFKTSERVKILYPTKHLLIQKKREVYRKLRIEMEKALTDYKIEKKDYYLARMQRGQKIN